MSTASQVRNAAVTHVEGVMYDGVEADVVGMTNVNRGTRVGLEVEPEGPSLGGALLGALLGLLVGVLAGLVLVFAAPPLLVPVAAGCLLVGGYVGATRFTSTEYATVTVDGAGRVVQENRDCAKGDFDRMLGREVSANVEETYGESRARHRARRQEDLLGNVAERFLFGSERGETSYSTPNQCPRCGNADGLLSPGFSELSDGQYQCDDCGHIVDLRPGD
jgi:hypothetical protein